MGELTTLYPQVTVHAISAAVHPQLTPVSEVNSLSQRVDVGGDSNSAAQQHNAAASISRTIHSAGL